MGGCKKCRSRMDWVTDGKDADGCHEVLMCSQCYTVEKKYFPCDGAGDLVDVADLEEETGLLAPNDWDWDTLPF